MQDLTIIGAGISVQTFIEQLKNKGYSKGITLIDKDDLYFSRPGLISKPNDVSNKLDLTSWAKESGTQFINDKVERVNLKRRKIYFKDSEAIEFKKLIIATGLCSNKLELKGQYREGFFYLSKMNPLKLKDLIKISKESVVDVSTFLGIRLAKTLSSLGLEVRITALGLDFLGSYKERIINYFNEKNIVVNLDVSIDEAVGESAVKAIKVKPLKVFSSQMLFVDSGLKVNFDFFEEEVEIVDTFFSNYQDIYFLGDVNNSQVSSDKFCINNYSECKRQALVFAEYIQNGTRSEFVRKDIGQSDLNLIVKDYFGSIKQTNAYDRISENNDINVI